MLKCCFGKLRTASLFHGWTGIVLIIIAIIIRIRHAISVNSFVIPPQFDGTIQGEILNQIKADNLRYDIVALVIHILDVLFSGILIGGIMNKKHLMLLPWLIYRAIELIICIPYFIYAEIHTTEPEFLLSVILLCIFGFFIWSWIVIFSFFKELKN